MATKKKAAKKKTAKKKAAKPKPAAAAPQRTITIEGKFGGGVNNSVVVHVFRPKSSTHPFKFKETFTTDFKETIKGLQAGLNYDMDFVGHTTTTFKLEVSGDFDESNPIKASFQKADFSPGFSIITKS